jgi:hypothetical protein
VGLTPRRVGLDERRARLARRHHLSPDSPATDIAQLARQLVGLHATDPATIYLSAWARIPGVTVADIERAFYDDLTVVRHLAMRRTLFVVTPDLVDITQAAATDAVAARMRKRLAKELVGEGVTTDGEEWLTRVIDATVAAVHDAGPSTGAQLAKLVPSLQTKLTGGGPTAAAVTARVITLAAAEGELERDRPQGSWTSTTHRWRIASPRSAPIDKREATAELIRRWLLAFGPAPITDIAWWTGLGVTEVQTALTALSAVRVDLVDSDEASSGQHSQPAAILAEDDQPPPDVEPWVALLPSLDPTPMGWKSRDWFLGDHAPRLFDRTGNIGPTVWSDGRVVGGWAVRRGDEKGTSHVVFELFEDVGRAAATAIADRAGQLEQWLAGTTVTPRFPTPIDRELRA